MATCVRWIGRISISLTTVALTTAAFVWSSGLGMAADKAGIDPTGIWKVTTFNPQTNQKTGAERTLKIKVSGDKLTGTISHTNGGKTEDLTIEEGKLNGDEISFTTHNFARVYQQNVLQPRDTNNLDSVVLTKYQGKISGDAIKGKQEVEWSGNTMPRNWEAKRVKP